MYHSLHHPLKLAMQEAVKPRILLSYILSNAGAAAHTLRSVTVLVGRLLYGVTAPSRPLLWLTENLVRNASEKIQRITQTDKKILYALSLLILHVKQKEAGATSKSPLCF